MVDNAAVRRCVRGSERREKGLQKYIFTMLRVLAVEEDAEKRQLSAGDPRGGNFKKAVTNFTV